MPTPFDGDKKNFLIDRGAFFGFVPADVNLGDDVSPCLRFSTGHFRHGFAAANVAHYQYGLFVSFFVFMRRNQGVLCLCISSGAWGYRALLL